MRKRSRRGGQAPRARRRVGGRGTAWRSRVLLPAPTNTRSAPRAAAARASKTGRARTAVWLRPCTAGLGDGAQDLRLQPVVHVELGAQRVAVGAGERIALGGVEDADGDDRRLPAGGLAQRPDQRTVGRRRPVDLDEQPRALPTGQQRRQPEGFDGGRAGQRLAGCIGGVRRRSGRRPLRLRRPRLAHGGIVTLRRRDPQGPMARPAVTRGRRTVTRRVRSACP